jgi:hypothetical protein
LFNGTHTNERTKMFAVNGNRRHDTHLTLWEQFTSLCKVTQSKLIFSIQILQRTTWQNNHESEMKSNDNEL